MKTLVTGGAGFVGSKVTEILLESGQEVVILDSLNDDLYSAEDKSRRLAGLTSRFPALEVIKGDIRFEDSFELLNHLIGEIGSVIHLAAMAGQRLSWRLPQMYLDSNAKGSLNLASWAIGAGVKHFTNVSTSSVYGAQAIGSEDSPLKPTSPYGASKVAAEEMASMRLSQSDIGLATVRLFSVYGPEQRPDMAYRRIIDSILNKSVFRLYGDGNQSRTNTFVTDAANGIIQASLGQKSGTYNIGGDESVTLNQAISMIEELMGGKLQVNKLPSAAGDQIETRADTKRARSELGFSNTVPLTIGLQRQIEWQARH